MENDKEFQVVRDYAAQCEWTEIKAIMKYKNHMVYNVRNPKFKPHSKTGIHLVTTDEHGNPYLLQHQDVSAIYYALKMQRQKKR